MFRGSEELRIVAKRPNTFCWASYASESNARENAKSKKGANAMNDPVRGGERPSLSYTRQEVIDGTDTGTDTDELFFSRTAAS